MNISLAAIYFALTIPFGNIDPIYLDFGIYPALGVNWNTHAIGGASPIGYFYSTERATSRTHREELRHIKQMEALGIYFFAAYVIDPGMFEPYEPSSRFFGYALNDDATLHSMWMPPKEIERQFPQWRITFNPGNTDVQFLPGYFSRQ